MTSIKTNEIIVVRAAEAVTVAVNGENKRVTWDELRRACNQDDMELAQVYQDIHSQACAMVANGPVVVSVHQDYTNVWWVCTVRAYYGGGDANYPRHADEGGTHPNHLLAALEAASICDRLGKRVIAREGFDAAKARERKLQIIK